MPRQLAPQAQEERLERERRRELELLGFPPGGPHELAGALGRQEALAGRVRPQVGEPVDVHHGALRARREDDEVAVPPLELLEHREQLVALRAALGAAHPLLGLPAGQLEHGDGLLRLLLRLGAALCDAREQDLGAGGRVETRVEVDVPGDGDQRLAASRGRRVEQAGRPVEPPRRDAGERRHLGVGQLRRVGPDRLAHRALRQAPERDELAARANRLGQRPEVARQEEDHRIRRRLLEVLEQGVGRVLVHRVRTEHQVDAPRRLERPHVQVPTQLTDVVDADLVAHRLEHVEVGVRAALDAHVVAEQLRREQEREPALADARRAVQEVRVRRSLGEGGREQALRLELLGDPVEAHRRRASAAAQTSPAISSTSRTDPSSPAAGTTRHPSRRASSR